jgi:hypothetical protein
MIALQLPRGGAPAPLCDVHHLPCHLSHDGSAKVSTYFLPKAAPGGGLVAHLRGRELAGLEAPLPAGVEGAVFRELQGSELVSATAAAAAAAAAAAPAQGSRGGGGGGGDDDLAEDDDCDGLFGGGGMGSDGEGSGYGQDEDEGGGGGARRAAAAKAPAAAAAAAAATPAAASAASRPSGRVWALDARFTKVTTWQHDTPATEQDMLPRALEWMRLAAALHDD